MERDKRVAVVTDSGSSIRPDSPEARDLGVTVVPLEINLWLNGRYNPHPDSDINAGEFYTHMRTAEKLPQTSGGVPGPLTDAYKTLRQKHESILSIHITSKHSAACASANLARSVVLEEENPGLAIEVADSKQASIAEWFCVDTAAKNSLKGAGLEQLKQEVDEVSKKTHILVTLDTLENLKRGGRGDEILKAYVGAALSIYPVITIDGGKLKNAEIVHGKGRARTKMLEMVGDAGKLTRVAVVHTNAIHLAENIKLALSKIFPGEIPVYEAGPVLAVHAGEGAVGIAYQIV